MIEPSEVYDVGSSIPHTTHCLGNGDIMISCMGDGPDQNGKGSFILIDGKSLKVKGTYAKGENDIAPFGYVSHIGDSLYLWFAEIFETELTM